MEWHKVTWYSITVAVILFIIVLPAWTFYLGTQYEKTVLAEASLAKIINR